MRLRFRVTDLALGLLATSFLVVAPAIAQQAGGRAGGRGGFAGLIQSSDPRVQNRTYHFAHTNVDLPHCVFVSSKVAKPGAIHTATSAMPMFRSAVAGNAYREIA